MNIITNTLFSFYLYFLFNLNQNDTAYILAGLFLPYTEDILLLFTKNKFKFKNKLLHSVAIIPGFLMVSIFNFKIFTLILTGFLIHVFSDLTKSKDIHILYPFSKKSFSLSISDYFDITPTIILLLGNFTISLVNMEFYEKLLPLFLMILYFSLKYFIKKTIEKNLRKTIKENYNLLIHPTIKSNIWNVIRIAENNIYVFGLDIFKRKYLFIKYFKNSVSEKDFEILNKSETFKKFTKNIKYRYSQTLPGKNGYKTIRIFDVKNFFNLFKKEQVYYEAVLKDDLLVKEKITI